MAAYTTSTSPHQLTVVKSVAVVGGAPAADATQALLLLRLLQEEEGWRCWGTHGEGGIDAGRGGKERNGW